MAVNGQSHLLWRSWVPDHIYHSNIIVRIVPTEVPISFPNKVGVNPLLTIMWYYIHTNR